MKTTTRSHNSLSAATLAGSLLLIAPVAMAASVLGEPVVQSAIGEPLRVELRVLAGGTSAAGECLRVVPGPAGDSLPWVRDARISAEGRGNSARIVVSHPSPVHEPVLKLALEDICEARLRREYTLLLGFPAEIVAPTPTIAADARPRERRVATPPGAARKGTRSPGSAPSARAILADRAARPARNASRAAQSRPRLPAAAARPELDERDRLVLGSGDERSLDGLRLSTEAANSGPADSAGDAERELLRREQRAAQALDQGIVDQLALTDRIRRLEEVQAALMLRGEQLLAATAAAAQPAAAVPARANPAATRDDWLYPMGALAGVSLLLAMMLLWRRRQRSALADETPGTASGWKVPSKDAGPGASQVLVDATFPDEPAMPARTRTPYPAPPAGPHATLLPWGHPVDVGTPSIAPINVNDEDVEEHESAIELAEIMMGFGRMQGAAETLAEFIRSNPRQSVTPWLKLLDVYRAAGYRAEFDALARQLNKTFNVKAVNWDTYDEDRKTTNTIEQMPHLIASVQQLWGTRDCQAYLHTLVRDNRDGTRQGFPLAAIDEILVLARVLEEQLGPYRPEKRSASTADASAAKG